MKHQRHDGDEDQRAPDLVGEHPVEPVADRLAGGRKFGGDGLLDGGDGRVAALDGGTAPIHAGGVQPLPGGGDGLFDLFGVMTGAGGQGPFIAQDEKGFGPRLGPLFLEGLGEQAGERVGFLHQRGGSSQNCLG